MTLGLNRKIPDNGALSPSDREREREHRIRVFWTAYILDRVFSSKVGRPVMLRDEDIDTDFPSDNFVTDLWKDDFHDASFINAQRTLAKITGNILNNIYGIPQSGRSNQSVWRIFKSLEEWRENLPSKLRFNNETSPPYSCRSVASLHLNFCQVSYSSEILALCLLVKMPPNIENIVCHTHHEAHLTPSPYRPLPTSVIDTRLRTPSKTSK